MELKKYQKNTLETLEKFLKELRKAGLKYAFMGITEKPYHADAFGDIPFVCIKIQTLKKFKDRKDWHRRALDEAFGNNIKVFSNEEALSIRKEDVSDNLCIVIASLEAFRKEKTLQKKYKVYQENGTLLDHFENIDEPDYLERDSEGTVINSLA